MGDRFFAEDLVDGAETYLLTGSEAHHLRTVLRGKRGDHVVLLDGRGRSADAVIESVARGEVECRITGFARHSFDSAPWTLFVAMPKGDRADLLVEKCVELGVAEIQPIETVRSVAEVSEGKQARWRRTAMAAVKQCGRWHLPTIGEPMKWSLASQRTQGIVFDVEGPRVSIDDIREATSVAIGPEGGWTSEERTLAISAGWRIATMGGSILRVETAAISVAAIRNLLSR